MNGRGTAFAYGTVFILYIIHLVRTTLATVPASVASNAPVRVNRVFVTFAAKKYTLMV